jgi:hypothetical protein
MLDQFRSPASLAHENALLIELGSRRVAHVGVTRSPSTAWATQQLREATAWGEGPRFLIRDNDAKFGPRFDGVAMHPRYAALRNLSQHSQTGRAQRGRIPRTVTFAAPRHN